MGEKVINTRIKHKFDTEANWRSNDPVLLAGELAFSSDTVGKYKIGNGGSKWSELPYAFSNELAKIGTIGDGKIVGTSPINASISNGVATISHVNSGITAGTYRSVTVNEKGHVTAGSNPTTLSGYGITDAASKNHTHSYLPLSGGNMVGTAFINWTDTGNWSNNNSGVTFPVRRGGLSWSGQSDGIQLYAEETGNDNLELVLKFTNDNSNGLSIRNKDGNQTARISSSGLFTGSFQGNISGNASTATKATQDSAGQQINTTYIKGLSVSGRTITYTKGDGTTGTITTQDTVYSHPNTSGNKHIPAGGSSGQILRWSADGTAVWGADNNTTYSTGTASTSGLTKLYTVTGTATDGTMTQAAIKTALDGKSATGHTHNYAGSSSAGGNANAAVKLATARKIGNASFDGTADITLSQIGVSIATSSNLGIIKPDGKTTFVDENGVLSAKTGTTLAPKPVSNLAIKNGDQSVTITWEDPIDTVVDGTTISTWAGTKLVMNRSRYPTDPSDGIVIVDNTTRNKYKYTGFTYSGLTNGVKYYFALFPYNTNDIYNYDNGNRILGEPQESSKIVTFADGTDEEIINMIQRHYAGEINISDYWSVGDIRKVYLSAMAATNVGEAYSESHRAQYVEFVIGDFDHDDLAASINGHGTAAVTLLQKDCLMDADNEANPVNGQNNTENGYINSSSSNYGGWDNCERRTWCNEVYLNALPSTIKDAVKTVYKRTTSGSKSSDIKLSTDKVFLASEYEILGRIDYAAAKEGYQYQYYTLATANRYKNPKYNQNQFSAKYWTRSPYKDNVFNFCDIGIAGNGGSNLAYATSGIAPCICL